MKTGNVIVILMFAGIAGAILMAMNESRPGPTPAQASAQKLRYCDLVLADKPIAELTQRDLSKLRECQTLRILTGN